MNPAASQTYDDITRTNVSAGVDLVGMHNTNARSDKVKRCPLFNTADHLRNLGDLTRRDSDPSLSCAFEQTNSNLLQKVW